MSLETYYNTTSGTNREACNQRYTRKHERVQIQSYAMLQPYHEENLKIAVALLGPVSVNIKVTDNFLFYKSGVFFDQTCLNGGSFANHAVLLVGYGDDPFAGTFWVIQNNWGVHWGEKGFARMARNTFINCGIPAAPFYPIFLN